MAAPTKSWCTCDACRRARSTLEQIFCVFNAYEWLIDSYIVDFFQDDLWEKLPKSWRDALENASPREFGTWLSGDILRARVWPLSLLALHELARNLQISRDHENPESAIRCSRSKDMQSVYNVEQEACTKAEVTKVNHVYSKHVKKRVKIKKQYEINKISEICANCAAESKTKCVVDIGAGMGHLARVLAFQYNLCTICIEQDPLLSQQACKYDRELLKIIHKSLDTFHIQCPHHLSVKLEPSSLAESRLITSLQRTFKENFDLHESEDGTEPRFICIVGCCYMKLTLRSEDNVQQGYPLSSYLSSKHSRLSYTALELGCHAVEKFSDKLQTENYEDLIVHTYRAALETILIRKSKTLRHSQVKNVKVSKGMTFQQYCHAATSNLDPDFRPQPSDTASPDVQDFLKRWQRVIIFSSLRVMLAPLVETVVLLDRFLYLSEGSLSPTLKPIFDARLSPRNFVLLSVKK
ncbi:hypothetical protein KM043_004479 [Ampulex compressa]|nr:hypothetical protein KM043_004479 [Ampulex compressa]